MNKINCYTYGHNEIDLLPLKKKWCDYHGLTMCYFDNESTDGSREWAIENGVFVDDIITNGAFDLRLILPPMNIHLQNVMPDYFCMLGVDLFICPPRKVKISEVLKKTFNIAISCNYANICFTGQETQNGDLRNFQRAAIKGTYSNAFSRYTLLGKFHPHCAMGIDQIHFNSKTQVIELDWYLLNFGHTKTAAERNATLERRKKAWENGLSPYAGMHYLTGQKLNWIYPLKSTIDVNDISELGSSYKELMTIIYGSVSEK